MKELCQVKIENFHFLLWTSILLVYSYLKMNFVNAKPKNIFFIPKPISCPMYEYRLKK